MKRSINKGKSWEEIKKAEPMLYEDEFIKFKEDYTSLIGQEWTEWGRSMRELNIGN